MEDEDKYQGDEEIFFSDDSEEDEDEASKPPIQGNKILSSFMKVSNSLAKGTINKIEAKIMLNHIAEKFSPDDEDNYKMEDDKPRHYEANDMKDDSSPLSDCFSEGGRCANCVSKLVYDPVCRGGRSQPCSCPKCRDLQMIRCTGCWLVSYCSETCQQEHWDKNHKKMCKVITGVSPISQRRRKKGDDLKEDDVSVDWDYCRKVMERSKENICHIYWNKFQYHTQTSRCDCKSVNKGTANIYNEERSSKLQFPFKIGEVKEEFIGWIDEYLFHISRLLIMAVSVNLSIIMKDKILSRSYGSVLNYLHYLRATYFYLLTIERTRPATEILFALKVSTCGPKDRYNSIFGGNPLTNLDELWNVKPKKPRYIPFIHHFLEPIIVHKNAYWETFLITMNEFFKRLRRCKYLVLNFDDIPQKKEENVYNTRIYYEMALKKLREKVNIVYPLFSIEHPLHPKYLKILPENTMCCLCPTNIGGRKAQQQIQHRFDPWFTFTSLKPRDVHLRFERYVNIGFPVIHEQDIVKRPIISCGRMKWCINEAVMIAGFYEFKEASAFVYFLQHSRLCEGCQRYSVSTHKCSKCLSVRYCSQRCLSNDWKYHRMTCQKAHQDEESSLGSRRLKGSEKEKHNEHCESLLRKFDPVLATIKVDGYRRNYCDYEISSRCLEYKPDKLRLDTIPLKMRDCVRCGMQTCHLDCEPSCVLM